MKIHVQDFDQAHFSVEIASFFAKIMSETLHKSSQFTLSSSLVGGSLCQIKG